MGKKPQRKVRNMSLRAVKIAQAQTHVHEFLGSTKLAEPGNDRHNHRFAGDTGQVIPCGNSHVHRIVVNTVSWIISIESS